MKITISESGKRIKLDKVQSEVLMNALYKFTQEHWNDNFIDKNELNTNLGLIQWLSDIFQED